MVARLTVIFSDDTKNDGDLLTAHYKKLFNLLRILRDVFRKRHEFALHPKTL
jgi:hypothetical protein